MKLIKSTYKPSPPHSTPKNKSPITNLFHLRAQLFHSCPVHCLKDYLLLLVK